jgi:hypothetical protein
MGDCVGCFQVVAEFCVVDGQPPQVAEGSLQLISQPGVLAAEPGIPGCLLLRQARAQVSSAG